MRTSRRRLAAHRSSTVLTGQEGQGTRATAKTTEITTRLTAGIDTEQKLNLLGSKGLATVGTEAGERASETERAGGPVVTDEATVQAGGGVEAEGEEEGEEGSPLLWKSPSGSRRREKKMGKGAHSESHLELISHVLLCLSVCRCRGNRDLRDSREDHRKMTGKKPSTSHGQGYGQPQGQGVGGDSATTSSRLNRYISGNSSSLGSANNSDSDGQTATRRKLGGGGGDDDGER